MPKAIVPKTKKYATIEGLKKIYKSGNSRWFLPLLRTKKMTPKLKRNPAFYSISAVAKMFDVHQQTIRLYEQEGLISPKRSEGNTRLFSEEDIDKLEEIIYLTHKLGVNIAGVELVLKLKKQIAKMQKEMNALFENTQQELDKTAQGSKELVQESAQRLIKIRHGQKPLITAANHAPQPEIKNELPGEPLDLTNWEIEYEND